MLRNLEQFNLAEIEEKVLKFWKEKGIFEKSLELRRPFDGFDRLTASAAQGKQGKNKVAFRQAQGEKTKVFRFFEGPPYANGKPGIHHVLARVFKDIILRFKTMSGYYVPRKAGWDTHGLPVEIDTEKQLGLKSKKDIEKFGIAAFNKKAKEGVLRYKDEFERLTERIGYWLDMKDAYVTYANQYIETLWWIFKEIDKRKLLVKGHKVVPWCTRCGTALASHELAQGYKEVTDTAVYVKFKLKKGQKIGKNFTTDDNTYILSWTTTPWTLPGNVALAVKADIEYVVIPKSELPGTFFGISRSNYILSKDIFWKNMESGASIFLELRSLLRFGPDVIKKDVLTYLHDFSGFAQKYGIEIVKGQDLVGLEYKPLFEVSKLKDSKSYRIYAADFVTTTDGTGVVHTAVMYGEDDYRLGKEVGLPQHHTVSEDGHFTKDVKELAGFPAKDSKTDEAIFAHLAKKGFLLKTEKYAHEYPFCWRCFTPLLYYARDSWFIEMSKLRSELVKANSSVNWVPSYLKEGRFGEWLREAKDWNISRERYWGTPLPIWECIKCGHHLVIGSLKELDENPWKPNMFFIARHGDATANGKEVIAAGPEKGNHISRLTAEGRVHVENTAKGLKTKKIDLIFTSPYLRTRQTAAIIAKATGAKVVTDKRLREMDAGVMNWKPAAQYHAFFKNEEERFTKAPEGGETLTEVKRRMVEFWKDINARYEGKRIVIVSHGSPLLMLEAALKGLRNEEINTVGYQEPGTARKLEAHNWPYDDDGNIDLHRPYADAIALKCEKCGKKAMRIKEVADVWFDSGAMPYAEWHYPFENRALIDKAERFPADYIAEGLDQTRGWFYTLLAIAVLLKRGAPYHNVLTLGLILDKHGQKMSKSKGNVVDPWAVIQKFGIDTVRWYFFTSGDPAEPKKFDEMELAKTFRKFFLILYNSFAFLETYSGKHIVPLKGEPKHILDRWILARFQETTKEVTEKLNAYDIAPAGRALEAFLDDLSRWYIRRSRARLQESSEAQATLAAALLEFSKLLAPFAPFTAEALYQTLKGLGRVESVHLEDWPTISKAQIAKSKELVEAMAEVRRIAAAGLALRAEAKIRIRQPLSALKLKVQSSKFKIEDELLDLLKDEVNVKGVIFDPKVKNEVELDTKITPELYEEGVLRELIRAVQDLRKDAKLTVKDSVEVSLRAAPELLSVVQKYEKDFMKSVGAKRVIPLRQDEKIEHKCDAEIETTFNDKLLWVAVRKT